MNYVFILGTPRSGGTLLYNILCNDLEINPPVPENHLINDIGNIYFNIAERFEIEKIQEDKIVEEEILERNILQRQDGDCMIMLTENMKEK